MRTALLIGGTGTISASVAKVLAASGEWRVFLLNRGNRAARVPPGAEVLTADMNDPAAVARALAGREFDVAADFIAYRPEDVERDIRLFSGRVGRYMFISSASAYQKPVLSLPVTESTPLRNPYWQYARDKIACEDALTRAYREDGFPAVIVRPSHTYGDFDFPTPVRGKRRNWQTLVRIREGKPVIIPGDGTSLWTVTHADDFAAGFVGLMGDPRVVGHAFHITSDDVLTWNEVYGLVAGALGVGLRAVHVASEKLGRMNPELLGNLLGDKANSAVFDNAKLRRFVPGYAPSIRFSDAVHVIVRNMLSMPELQIPDPEFDEWCDRVVAAELV